MKKLTLLLALAAFVMGSNAMAQQPQNGGEHKEHCHQHNIDKQACDKPCCDKTHQREDHACPHQQPGQHPQGAPAPQCCEQQGHHAHQHAFRPHGEAIVTLFEHFGATSTNAGWDINGFEMERAYFGYKYQFDPKWSATVILDAQQGNGTGIERVFAKNAFVKYHNHGLTLMAGIVPTVQGTLAESNWGYRYVAKSMYDLNGYGNTADLGFYAQYDLNDLFSFDLSILNGEGFRKLQLDNDLLYGGGITFSPYKGFNLRVYGDIQTEEMAATDTTMGAQKNLQIHAGYDHKKFRLGAEYNWQWNNTGNLGHVIHGFSCYATGKITPKFNIFARYDNGSSIDKLYAPVLDANGDPANSAWAYAKDGQDIFCGVEYRVNKLIALSPAIRYHIFADNSNSLYAYLSAKVAF